MNSGIYEILNLVTGDRYIGSAVNLKVRMQMHRTYLNTNKHANTHLQRAWNKYGKEAFRFNTIRYVHSTCLLIVEQTMINSYEFSKLYNICRVAGSHLGRKCSEETKQKISSALMGRKASPEACENLRLAREKRSGIPVSEETRRRLSVALKGKKRSPEICKKMSDDKKGKPNPGRIGKKHSPETIQKMRDDRKGRPSSRKGIKMSDETKSKLSLAHKGKKASDETKQKLSDMRRGRILSEFHRQAISKGLTGRKKSPEHVEAMRIARTGVSTKKNRIQ